MSDPKGVNIEIKTTADTAGAEKVARSLKDVGRETRETGDRAEASARSARGLNEAWNGLNEAMRGGAGAARGLGTAIGGLFTVLGRASWIGGLAKAVGIAISLFGALRKVFSDTRETAEEEARKSGEAWEKGLRAAGEARSTALLEYFDELEAKARRAKATIDSVTAAIVAQIDADEAVALAEIDADENRSDVEKLTAKADVRRKARAGRTAAELGRMDKEAEAAAEQTAGARTGVELADAGVQAARDAARRLREAEDPQAARRERSQLRNIFPLTEAAASSPLAKPEQVQRFEEQRARLAELDDIIKKAGKDDADYQTKTQKAREAVEAALADRAKAEERVAKLAEAEADLRDAQAGRRAVLGITSTGQQRVDDITTSSRVKDAERKAAEAAEREASARAEGAARAAREAEQAQIAERTGIVRAGALSLAGRLQTAADAPLPPPNLFDSPDRRRADEQAERERRQAYGDAARSIAATAEGMGDGRGELEELQKLVSALQQIASVVSAHDAELVRVGRQTDALLRQVSTLGSQAANARIR